jgi:toxin HigB-1
MIKSFRDRITEAVYEGESPKGFPVDLVKIARRKLGYLDAAVDLNDLRSPPGNRLEALGRDRDGQHSIRVNDQFRVCFIWTEEGPTNVEITEHPCRVGQNVLWGIAGANRSHKAAKAEAGSRGTWTARCISVGKGRRAPRGRQAAGRARRESISAKRPEIAGHSSLENACRLAAGMITSMPAG